MKFRKVYDFYIDKYKKMGKKFPLTPIELALYFLAQFYKNDHKSIIVAEINSLALTAEEISRYPKHVVGTNSITFTRLDVVEYLVNAGLELQDLSL